jgi:hypothetical protein
MIHLIHENLRPNTGESSLRCAIRDGATHELASLDELVLPPGRKCILIFVYRITVFWQ